MSGLRFERLAPVAVGAAAGAIARWGVFSVLDSATAALVLVNLIGTILLALVVARSAPDPAQSRRLDFAATGFCGAFTTFSTLAVQLAERLADGAVLAMGLLLGGLLVAAVALYLGTERLARRS